MISRYLIVGVLFWLSAVSAIVPASAQNADNLISRLISVGRVDDARRILESTDPSINDKAFFAGRVLKARRQFTEAIAVFRAILERDPGYLNARRELAHTFLLAGELDIAEFHFRRLLDVDPEPAMHTVYRRYLAVIARNKPVGISGSMALVPSSNVNRGSSLIEFEDDFGRAVISEDSRAQSGTGLQLGLSGYVRRIIDRDSRLTFNWALLGVVYREEEFNTAAANLSVGFEQSETWGRWTVAPYFRTNWAHQDEQSGADTVTRFGMKSRSVGLKLGLERRLSNQSGLSFGMSAESQDYPVLDYQSGPYYRASVSYNRRVRPDLLLSLGLAADRRLPRPDHLRYDGYRVSGSVQKIWRSGLRTGFGLHTGRREFYGDYIFRDYSRSDIYWGASVSLFSPRVSFRNFAPRLSCSYSRNRSNVEFFVYDVSECRISLTQEF